jgi:indole-3-acetate monooxygenase
VDRAANVAVSEAEASEKARRLTPALVDALGEAGMFTLCLPVAYGGPGIDMVEVLDAVASIAHADASAGWCAGIASTTSSLAAYVEPGFAREVYSSPSVPTGGVFAPNATGACEPDGFRATGRWQWGSGTQHCDWIVGGVMCDDGSQRIALFPRSDVKFHDTWHTAGLRGTGSLDFSVDDVFVPDPHSFVVGRPPTVDDPIARFPNFTLLSLGIASTAVGNARRALDELRELALVKTPQFSSKPLNRSGYAQTEFARAEARWRASRALLRNEVGAAWDDAASGRPVEVEARVAMRLAAAHAVSECVAVTEAAWTLAGGTAVYDSSALGRCVRDAHVMTQHIMVAPKLNETLGKHFLGADFDARMI